MTQVSKLPNPVDYPNGYWVRVVREDDSVSGTFCRCGDARKPFWQRVTLVVGDEQFLPAVNS